MDKEIKKIAFCLLFSLSVSYLGFFIMSQEPLECENDEHKVILCITSQPIGDGWVEEPDGTWVMCVKFYDNETITGEI